MASTRLRQTFRYPTDSDDPVEGIDEEEQEKLISSLSTQDTRSTKLYTQILLALPLMPAVLYIPRLFNTSTFLTSFAAILSLLASAYTLYYIPLPPVAAQTMLDAKSGRSSGKGKAVARDYEGHRANLDISNPSTKTAPFLSPEIEELVKKYITPVNGTICAILALHELSQGREWRKGIMISGGYVPLFIMVVVQWARRELRVVDLGELERLRYRYKGA
ncbi:hypothetical protein K469DRAFT_709159 [Zopfia rhizophila CBS 207.26]|uniref:Uncharacterized protein n=1 Tax=Zopfia rhizophila CBS 207.26 TaxID=1314779 RepID=A0A6A6DXJ6_9PEZI|nr:hypothetical protein K469DRAFT_709159 [Zopfia rhizophila CBS 207.26]